MFFIILKSSHYNLFFIEFLSIIKELTLSLVLLFFLRNFNNQDYSSNNIYFVCLLFLDILIFLANIC